MPKTIGTRIGEFAALVQKGIDAWTKAGELLVAILEEDPTCFEKITGTFPEISTDMLQAFERIGRKEIYAPLLADSSPGARRLLEMPYALQETYCRKPIEVAVAWKNGHIKSLKKRIGELSRAEVAIVFGRDEINSLDAQAWRLKEESKVLNPDPVTSVTTTEVGYFSITCDKAGKVNFEPCAKSLIAQSVLLYPASDGWKSAIVLIQRVKPK